MKIFVAKRSISVKSVCKCIALELKDKINRRYPLAIVVAMCVYLIYFGVFRNHIMAENYGHLVWTKEEGNQSTYYLKVLE